MKLRALRPNRDEGEMAQHANIPGGSQTDRCLWSVWAPDRRGQRLLGVHLAVRPGVERVKVETGDETVLMRQGVCEREREPGRGVTPTAGGER